VDCIDLFTASTRLYYLADRRTEVSEVKTGFLEADYDCGNVITDTRVIPLR
jgi:hypothetical protein